MKFIVGLDPGLYTAVVLVDLKGNLIEYAVRKDWGEEGVVGYILARGKPVLFATDVAKTPSFVEKIAARFHSPVFSPSRDLTKEEKAKLSTLKDPHARDAHAAALKAYHYYENRFRSVEKHAASPKEAEEAKEKIVRGMMAFHKPMGNRESRKTDKENPKVRNRKEGGKSMKESGKNKEREELLREIIRYYKERCRKMEERLKELEKKIRGLKRKKRVTSKLPVRPYRRGER